eukprot:scaffold266335_cov26-Tisochrysis_lutea.AAC.2
MSSTAVSGDIVAAPRRTIHSLATPVSSPATTTTTFLPRGGLLFGFFSVSFLPPPPSPIPDAGRVNNYRN